MLPSRARRHEAATRGAAARWGHPVEPPVDAGGPADGAGVLFDVVSDAPVPPVKPCIGCGRTFHTWAFRPRCLDCYMGARDGSTDDGR